LKGKIILFKEFYVNEGIKIPLEKEK